MSDPKQLLYILGVPGSGKTSLVRTAMARVPHLTSALHGVTFLRYPGGIELGAIRDTFSGTDALPMNVQPAAVHFLKYTDVRYVLAEGDRLANGHFFNQVQQLGWALSLCWLKCPSALAARRRAQRGSQQDETWVRGRETKVRNLVQVWHDYVWALDARLPLDVLVSHLLAHPVLQHLVTGQEVAV